MRYAKVTQGRVFVLALDHGEIVHEAIERFAAAKKIRAAALILLGGADRGSRLVAGPADGDARPVASLEVVLDDVREIAGTGTLFPDERGAPILHLHAACGRGGETITGCVRRGVKVWRIGEAILFELLGCAAVREFSAELGFAVLNPRAGEAASAAGPPKAKVSAKRKRAPARRRPRR
ncbi:MAG: DNA-binding protein [Candidatus Aureabacteria bacterium]|nr:DNA-binding protein [Candidatus Auribacterota bacterium]NLW92986.1 DNA-binding protein [Chlamydiota bacterium]